MMLKNTNVYSLLCGLVTVILALALLVLATYTGYYETLYGWRNLTQIPLHTIYGIIIVGSGLSLYGLWEWSREKFDIWKIAPFSIAVVVALLTFFAWYTIEEQTRARNNAYMKALINDTQAVLLDRYHIYEEALRGGLGLYYASKSVEREEWKNYVNALETAENLPGINGIGYIDYVLSQNLDTYLENVRADGAPDFKNYPDTFYPDKFIIKFIEPVENNIEAVGLDIGFEANRRAAAERARDLGVPALTKKILLVQDDQKQPGFLLLLPVYKTKYTPETIEERRKNFQGWVYAPFIGPHFFKDVGQVNKNQLYLKVFDGKKKTEEALIYDSGYNHDTHHLNANVENIISTQMKIAGRIWTLEWHPTENFSPPANKNLDAILLFFGMGFSVFLYFTLSRLLYSKELIQQKVEERTRELKESEEKILAANKELQRSNHELERFAYIASHDLQEPLRKIGGFTERLEKHLSAQLKDDEKAGQYMAFVTDGVTRMRELIMGLLLYSRVTTSEIHTQKFDVNDVINDAMEALSEIIAENSAQVLYKDLPEVDYDKVMLTQLFQNLISNAIKYRGKETPYIKISATTSEKFWEFSVQDNGMGIEEKYLDRIFEMFQRLHRKEEISGTGIGLSLCQKIVERYGGTIWVTSKPGKGSTFFFTVPKQI